MASVGGHRLRKVGAGCQRGRYRATNRSRLSRSFDIAVRTDGRGGIIAPRRELRFLTRSIEHYRLTLGCRRLELSWTEMFGLIVPPDKASLTGIEVDSVLN